MTKQVYILTSLHRVWNMNLVVSTLGVFSSYDKAHNALVFFQKIHEGEDRDLVITAVNLNSLYGNDVVTHGVTDSLEY